MNKINKNLTTCKFCQRQFLVKNLCPPCRKRDVHHGEKAPQGVCQQCLEKDLPLTKAWNDKYYCQDCLEWNDEGTKSGIATCVRYTHNKELNCYDYETKKHCQKCQFCQERKKVKGISTIALMTELYWGRKDFNALVTWEDDGFITRFQEIMWELDEVKGWTPKRIEKAVNQDIFEKKLTQRKFSRGI